VTRRIAILGCALATVAGGAAVAGGSRQARLAAATVTLSVGPTRLLAPEFGYTVAYKAVARGATARTTIGLFVYDRGRWLNVTPPRLRADLVDGIDDVAFTDRRHGWVAGYSCAKAAVYLYRTSDGGRSWQSLGRPSGHSCGGGPTYLSFVDTRHGWMEPVSPNAPGGELLRTSDGGVTWSLVASLDTEKPFQLPCLAPIAFTSRSNGWMGHSAAGFRDNQGRLCAAHVYESHDAGQTWKARAIRLPRSLGAPVFDVPRFFGQSGVVSITLGAARARAVAFAVSANGGRSWSLRSLRPISSCPWRGRSWPVSVAGSRVWWIVAGQKPPVVRVTSDAGRHWHSVAADGLPARSCAVKGVSAANSRVAWVVSGDNGNNGTALFQTRDGGRTWTQQRLLPG